VAAGPRSASGISTPSESLLLLAAVVAGLLEPSLLPSEVVFSGDGCDDGSLGQHGQIAGMKGSVAREARREDLAQARQRVWPHFRGRARGS
jgi:hypothetical protein